MAKKTSSKADKQQRKMAKVILSVKSSKTGAYTFKEFMVPQDEVDKALAKDSFSA